MKLMPAFATTFFVSAVALVAGSPPNNNRTLQELAEALSRNDGSAVHRLTEQLRIQVPEPKAPTASKVPEPSAPTKAAPAETRSFLSARKQGHGRQLNAPAPGAAPPWSLFDDSIFAMTAAGKAELGAELLQPHMANAIQWIKTGGWYNCALENEMCSCTGQVRYGHPHSKKWTSPQEVSGVIHCSITVFGGLDIAPGKPKECQCHRSAFHMQKRETSTSLMQESFIFLLRLLAMTKLLPTGTGDRKFHGMELWSARHGGRPGGCLERYWIDKYINDAEAHVPGFRCLEWGVHYTNYFPQCTEKWDVKYEPVKMGQVLPHVAGNIVYSDIYSFPTVLGMTQFNFIMATQLFEHIEKPFEAAVALFKVVAPGGAVLYTGPQQAQFHMVPEDFLRYTKMEVKYIFEQAGFCVPPHMMAGSGDFVFDAARDMGLQVQDFTNEELDEGYQFGYDNIAEGAITIHAMLYKPPHTACNVR